jgi:hypothetical protein
MRRRERENAADRAATEQLRQLHEAEGYGANGAITRGESVEQT